MAYYCLYPALFIGHLSTLPQLTRQEVPLLPMAGAMITGLVVVAGVCLFLQARARFGRDSFAAMYFGALRTNLFVSIAASTALFGQEGITLAAMALVTVIPLVTLLGLPIAAMLPEQEGPSSAPAEVLLAVCKHPFLLACLAGISLHVSGVVLPEIAYETLRLLGLAAVPVSLMAVGAGLSIGTMRSHWTPIALSALLKLVALPGATWLACHFYKTPPRATAVCILFAAAPAAATMFHELQPDRDQTLEAIITGQTLFALVTLPLAMYLLL